MHFGRDRFRGQNNGLGLAGLISVSIIPELSMGPFCVTRSNLTQPITSGKIRTQLDPTKYN